MAGWARWAIRLCTGRTSLLTVRRRSAAITVGALLVERVRGAIVCQRVVYSSQSDDEMDGLWRKQAKIEGRLGENWQQPKGMWCRTYERRLAQLWKLEERRDGAFALTRIFHE